jgi:predicted TIM-barrel fold metal-dependent hydrolase
MTELHVVEPLLDTHQHVIYRDRFRYSWTDSVPALRAGDFTASDYWHRAAEIGVSKTLAMETGVDEDCWQEETRYMLTLAEDPANRIAGIVAGCRPETDAGSFDAWLDELASTAVVGFRRILHVEPDQLSASAQFVRNVRQLGKRGKPFDMCFLERQLPQAVALARSCDDTRLILDHCGVPDIASGNFESWQRQIRRLAALPHVSCKLSGVIAYCPPGRDPATTIRPYLEHCMEAFGRDRLVWGSDWPVCNLTADIDTWGSIFRKLLASESDDVRNAVFMGNALEIYDLVD